MKIRVLIWPLIALAVLGAGCRRSGDSQPPVATAAVRFNHPEAPLGSPLEITYEFKVAAQAPAFTEDYRVFVHFKDDNDELMWTDDHDPAKPTSQWKPGETVTYTRLLFIPVYPYVGEASVELGLYGRSGNRLPLAGTDTGQRAYRLASIRILPQTENVYLTFKDGWHLAEIAPDNATNEWHWTKKEATLSFRNPKKDVLLYLDVDARSKLLTEPQTLTVRIGDQSITSFQLGGRAEVHRIPLAAAQLGGDDKVEVRLEVDKTFVPAQVTSGAQRDIRELGVRIFHAFIEAR